MKRRKYTSNGNGHEPMKFAVQSGVPIPDRSANRKYDWPFGTMNTGECFFIPCKDVYDANYRVRGAVYNAAKEWRQTGRRFTVRVMPGDKQVGVWRIQ